MAVQTLEYLAGIDSPCILLSMLLSVGHLTSQQYTSVSQGPIHSEMCMCCHTETEAAEQTLRLTQSQYIDTSLTSPSADRMMPGIWQGNHWSTNF